MAHNQECCDALIVVLKQVRQFIAMPEADFTWCAWHDQTIALAEIDGYLAALQKGESLSILQLEVLFLPTGPLQEVSMSSGWQENFLILANRFDDVITHCA